MFCASEELVLRCTPSPTGRTEPNVDAQTPEQVVSLTYLGSGWRAALNRLGYNDLQDYRASGRWKALEAEFRAQTNFKTCLCGETEGLTVDHVSLQHVGREQLHDLAYLCRACRPLLRPLVRLGEVNCLAAAKLAVTAPATDDECDGDMVCNCSRCRGEVRTRVLTGVRTRRVIPEK